MRAPPADYKSAIPACQVQLGAPSRRLLHGGRGAHALPGPRKRCYGRLREGGVLCSIMIFEASISYILVRVLLSIR